MSRDMHSHQLIRDLHVLRVQSLRNILMEMNIARSGRKSELIDRITNALEQLRYNIDHPTNLYSVQFYKEQYKTAVQSIHRQFKTCLDITSAPHPPQPPITYTPPRNPLFLQTHYPHELELARCFCTTLSSDKSLIKCISCDLTVHKFCHNIQTNKFICELCRSYHFDPCYQHTNTLLPPFFARFTGSCTFIQLPFLLTNEIFVLLQTNTLLQLQLRSFAAHEDLARGNSWPESTFISVNHISVPIVQRAPLGHSHPSTVLREVPLPIFPFCRKGMNYIEIRCKQSTTLFAFMVQIVAVQSVEAMTECVLRTSSQITEEMARLRVCDTFKETSEVETTCTLLSMRCPLSLGLMEIPARGKECVHLQCFDLKTYLQYNQKARSKPWTCIVCHKFIQFSDLCVDPFVRKLMRDGNCDEENDEFEIFPDATWKKKLKEKSTSDRKRMKVEREEEKETHVEIDLASISDEESDGNYSEKSDGRNVEHIVRGLWESVENDGTILNHEMESVIEPCFHGGSARSISVLPVMLPPWMHPRNHIQGQQTMYPSNLKNANRWTDANNNSITPNQANYSQIMSEADLAAVMAMIAPTDERKRTAESESDLVNVISLLDSDSD